MRFRHAAEAGAALVLLALAGCATAPVRPAAQWLGVLPDDATLYLSLDVPASADVIEAALPTAGADLRDIGPLLREDRAGSTRPWRSRKARPRVSRWSRSVRSPRG